MPRGDHPWKSRKSKGFGPPPREPKLTLSEVEAIKKAHGTGRFSMRGLGRIFDVSANIITKVVAGSYRWKK